MEGQIRTISRHLEGQEKIDSDPHKKKLQNYLAFCTHPDVRGFKGYICVYMRERVKKSCIANNRCFWEWYWKHQRYKNSPQGPKSLQSDRKVIKVWPARCGKISCNKFPLMCEVRGVVQWSKYIISPSQKWSDEEPGGRTSHPTIQYKYLCIWLQVHIAVLDT